MIEELSECDQRAIKLRFRCHIETICAYHFYIYHTSYKKRHAVCSDPFLKHKKKIKGQYNITLTFSDSVNCLRLPLALIPEKKLCSRCLNEAKHALQSLKENASPDDDIEENLNVPEEDWARENTFTPTKVIKALESSAVISPVQNLIKSSRAERLVIFDKVINSVRQNVLGESDVSSLKLEDYSRLLDAVRNKILTSKDRKERYSLLTLAPHSWSVPQVETYFDMTLHAAKISAALTVESGILPEIKGPKVCGRIITENDIQRMDFSMTTERWISTHQTNILGNYQK